MKQRMRYHFTGRVQGVGFRYTAYHIASALGLTGWVYNEWDGSVTMEVQGASSSFPSLLARLDASPFIRIEHIETEPLPLQPHESAFTIKD